MLLAALGIGNGILRLDAVRERSREELLTAIRSGHADLSGTIEGLLGEQKNHASYLSGLPSLHGLLRGTGDHLARREVEAHFLPYMTAFESIDRIRCLGLDGREVVSCVRYTRGLGALPPPYLDPDPVSDLLSLGQSLAPRVVSHTTLRVDHQKVESPESERQVIHFVTGIDPRGPGDGAARLGYLVVTVYAAPVLTAVREFAPVGGVTPFLVDADGSYLAHVSRERERGNPSARSLAADDPLAASLLAREDESADGDGYQILARTVSEEPRWRLMVSVPEDALEAAAGDLRGEYLSIIGTMVAIVAVLGLAVLFYVRLGRREMELAETRRQRELERQLQVSERLGSLGMLTAGVAHEINNPLEGIGNYLALLSREPVESDQRRRYLEAVKHGFHRIRDIVRDLSELSRREVGTGTADLRSVTEQATRLAAYDMKLKQVTIETAGFEEALPVPGDAGRLEQVFLNVILNAGRAMDGSGTLTITAGRSLAPDGTALVEITFDDDGPGIATADLDRIFDPFFTGSGGTGLGLTISHSIVSAHGGTLRAENREQGGARIRVGLPAGAGDRIDGR